VTLEYAPPEVLFSSRYHYNPALHLPRGQAHDVWSAGVILLELVLGSPHVFQLPPSTRAALDLKLQLQGKGDMERHLLYLLRGMMELCIYPPLVRLGGRRKGGD
jgi:serine/threonine protein kinase